MRTYYHSVCKVCPKSKRGRDTCSGHPFPSDTSWETMRGQIGEGCRKDLATPFGKAAKDFKNAKDVDKRLDRFHKKYAHLDKLAASDYGPDNIVIKDPKDPNARRLLGD